MEVDFFGKLLFVKNILLISIDFAMIYKGFELFQTIVGTKVCFLVSRVFSKGILLTLFYKEFRTCDFLGNLGTRNGVVHLSGTALT